MAPLYEWISVILSDRRQREAEREEQRRFGIFPTNQQEEEVEKMLLISIEVIETVCKIFIEPTIMIISNINYCKQTSII